MSTGAKNSVKSVISGIFEATLGVNGAVVRGAKLTNKQAVENQKKGYNVVVCGPDIQLNRSRAEAIERNAHGNVVHHAPSPTAGANALWHFQPSPRGSVTGHTFYESTGRSVR